MKAIIIIIALIVILIFILILYLVNRYNKNQGSFSGNSGFKSFLDCCLRLGRR